MAINDGNPNPPDNSDAGRSEHECPFCGELTKDLPDHVRGCEEAV